MKKSILVLSFPVTLLLGACDLGTTNLVPPAAQSVTGTVKLGTTLAGSSNLHTDTEAVGRVLNLRLNNPKTVSTQALSKTFTPMFTGRALNAQAITVSGAVLASTTVKSDLSFAMELPKSLPESQTFVMTNQWPREGGDARITCNRTGNSVSDPAARLAASEFTLEPGGSVDHQDAVADLTVTENASGTTQTGHFMFYADREVTYTMTGTCTMYVSQAIRTLNFDQVVALKKGWNVVTSLITSSPDGTTTNLSARVNLNWTRTLVGSE